jgi:sugar phosphate permease
MLAKLIVDSVPREVTGVAMGMNTVMRTIGGVIGGQIGAAVLASVTLAPPFPPIPTIDGFVAMFSVAAGIALLGAIFTTRIPKTTHL